MFNKKITIVLLFVISFIMLNTFNPLFIFPTDKNESSPNNTPKKDKNNKSIQEKKKVDITVSKITARISPQIEITLPIGRISEHFKNNFNNLWIIFNFYYNFIANEIGGDITFEYPIYKFLPYIKFKDYVDFESYIKPTIINNVISLTPTTKYLERNRIVEGGLKYNLLKDLNIFSSITFDDLFKGDLSNSRIIDQGTDIITSIGITYNSFKQTLKYDRLLYSGLYYKSSFNLKARDNFLNITTLDHCENLLLNYNFGKKWALVQNLNLGLPVNIWQTTYSSYYTLGGFDSIRGYKEQSINAFRFLSSSTTIHRKILKKNEIKKKVRKSIIYLHKFNFSIFYDQCLTQDQLKLSSILKYYPALGIGTSFVVSGQKSGHLKISIYMAQALKEGYEPIFYFKTSFFKFEK